MRARCPPPPRHPLKPTAGRRNGPGLTREGELALALTGYNIPEIRPCTSPERCRTADPGVGVGLQVSKPRGCKHGSPATCLPCGGMGKEEMPPPCPFPPMAGGRVGPKVIRARELALCLIYHSIWENRPCPSPAHGQRAGSAGEHETGRADSALAGCGIK